MISSNNEPFIVGLGGTTRAQSSTQSALEISLAASKRSGARVRLFSGADLLKLPMYDPDVGERGLPARELLEALRAADGIVLGSPAYHGSISGLIKNALDYTEDMREDDRPYLAGRACGLIATGYGWQGVVATLATLRQIVHSLRGYPTPLGAGINSLEAKFDSSGSVDDPKAMFQLETVGLEVLELAARLRSSAPVTLSL